MSENLMPITYICYAAIGISLTIWVARTLRIHGKVFLAKGCKGDDLLADALSHLLSVGFYLLHIGIVLLTLKIGEHATNVSGAIELLSTKTGFVLLVLAVSHFIYLGLYSRIHGKPKPPLPENEHATSSLRTALDH